VSERWQDPLSVPPPELERQVRRLLARGLRPCRAADLPGAGPRGFHVTFDDAYVSARAGLAALERLDVPASVYVCTEYADGGTPLAIPELAGEARRRPEELATFSWPELCDLADRGVDIGSHTCSHPHLMRLGDAELARELAESRARIEEQLRRPCTLLAYPYGEQDARVRTAARAAGYGLAFALPGRGRPLDPFALPRVGVYRGDTPLRVAAKAALVHGPVGRLRRLRRESVRV
jgi:peptidoglycan/xylan/chitin deacetylase (PgdA/CDA1 family)